jgi:hypothetical protein
MSIHQAPTEWVPVTDEIVAALHAKYFHWIDDLTEIRSRIDALRDELRIGWKPFAETSKALDDLNTNDER